MTYYICEFCCPLEVAESLSFRSVVATGANVLVSFPTLHIHALHETTTGCSGGTITASATFGVQPANLTLEINIILAHFSIKNQGLSAQTWFVPFFRLVCPSQSTWKDQFQVFASRRYKTLLLMV
jgi:hypothetical protein